MALIMPRFHIRSGHASPRFGRALRQSACTVISCLAAVTHSQVDAGAIGHHRVAVIIDILAVDMVSYKSTSSDPYTEKSLTIHRADKLSFHFVRYGR